MKIVSPPMPSGSKYSVGSWAFISPKPPALTTAIGSRSSSTPMVLTTNWTMSVSVIDHMPPSVSCATTIVPPRTMATVRFTSKRTSKMVAYAMVEVTASIRVYAHITTPEMIPARPP
ncbi:hypothetical protein SGRI78S_05893 [Streptomyces griseus subsp. griseus]